MGKESAAVATTGLIKLVARGRAKYSKGKIIFLRMYSLSGFLLEDDVYNQGGPSYISQETRTVLQLRIPIQLFLIRVKLM